MVAPLAEPPALGRVRRRCPAPIRQARGGAVVALPTNRTGERLENGGHLVEPGDDVVAEALSKTPTSTVVDGRNGPRHASDSRRAIRSSSLPRTVASTPATPPTSSVPASRMASRSAQSLVRL